jgi:preprotein translocase subunit SecE
MRQVMQRVREFLQEVQVELRRVTFPTRSETMGATVVVLAFVVVMSIYLALADALLARLVTRLIG